MNSQAIIWTSEGLHLNTDTCVDVKATQTGAVVLGQLGETWLHDLHLTPEQAEAIAHALLEGAQKAREAKA